VVKASYTTLVKLNHKFKVKKLIQLKYNTTAPSYDNLYKSEQLEKYSEIEGVLRNSILKKRNVAILDAGCGTCLLLEYLYQHILKSEKYTQVYYVGLDFSIGMLNQAKKRVHNLELLVDLVLADIDYLPLRSGVFHILTVITVIQNLPDIKTSLSELLRVLRDEGKLIISYPKKSNNIILDYIIRNSISGVRVLSSKSKDLILYGTK